MLIDPILSLAFSVYSNKGVYALLLGSGVSRAAGIPTGWEIVKDLVTKLAATKGQTNVPDPIEWFQTEFGEQPDYDKLLAATASTQAERQQLLKSYFEPTEEDREAGMKLPTAAHRAIAELVVSGYVRVIITTNFDRLTESAIQEAGVTPVVVSTADGLQGMPPLSHVQCLVLKVNGDYMDARIKNTPDELADYGVPLDQVLDRVFDEFGIIVCGWSAQWDTGLRGAIERCASRRFTTYWATKEPSAEAMKLIALRSAQAVDIQDANKFFTDLCEKLGALEDLDGQHPLSEKVAVANLKRLLPEDRHIIRVHDIISDETDRVCNEASHMPVGGAGISFSDEMFVERVKAYENLTRPLQAMMAVGCYWGQLAHRRIWTTCLQRLIDSVERGSGITDLSDLQLYPALLALYAAGVAAVAAQQYETLGSILLDPVFRDYNNKTTPLLLELYTWRVMCDDVQKLLPDTGNHLYPLSERLCEILKAPLVETIPGEAHYIRSFDLFEYMRALVHGDARDQLGREPYGPLGCFVWRRYGALMTETDNEIAKMGQDWPPLRAGLFGGSLDRLLLVKKTNDEAARKKARW